MIIRTATENDLDTILALGKEFGHSMLYQKDYDLMKRYLNRIIVAEVPVLKDDDTNAPDSKYVGSEVVGFYHYVVSGDPGFLEMLTCYRQMSIQMVWEASKYQTGQLCVAMQGACHRDAFRELIGYLQTSYPEIWCYNSVTDQSKPSSKIAGYRDLGFVYDTLKDQYRFFNIHKGAESTYQLGRWYKCGVCPHVV